jgi:23S rRNA pseudouridine2605 synthase
MLERLQKIIARAGIASRRHAEELIRSGLVTVNGETITELGSKADETKDHIKVQGKLLRPETDRVYLLLNKPPEIVSTMIDPEGRRTLSDLLYGVPQRVFPVGRLEYHSMGLVFLTNDGELANLILKARNLLQTYELKLKSLLTFDEIEALTRATGARITRIKGKDAPWYEVTLSEARRDALRNRLFQTGHPVEKIKRIKIGNLAMETLPVGSHRPLTDAEVATLRKLIQSSSEPPTSVIQRDQQSAFNKTPAPMRSQPQPFAARPGKSSTPQPHRAFGKQRPFQPQWKTKQPPRPFPRVEDEGSKPQTTRFTTQRPAAASSSSFKQQIGAKPSQPTRANAGPKRFQRPFDTSSKGFKPPFEESREHFRPPASRSKPFKRTFDGPRDGPRDETRIATTGKKPFQSRFDGPSDRSWSRASDRPNFHAKNRGPNGPKSAAPWKSNQARQEPGALGRSRKDFKPSAGPRTGLHGPKHGGPGGFKPKRGRFTGPKGRN